MTSRGKNKGCWDPMRDDYDNSYSAQYPDEEASDRVQLDHTKLYITKLPAALSKEGFISLFSKYGRVVHSFFSRDPSKNFAFVSFETSGEAKIAMMKLNNTEPFHLSICFAHRKNDTNSRAIQPNVDRSNSSSERPSNRHSHTDRQNRDDASVSSRGHKSRYEEEQANGNQDCDIEESDAGIDPSLAYDLEQLKHEQLQIMAQQLKVKQRMMIYQRKMKQNASLPMMKRRVLPDGQIQDITQDTEICITAGGGDSRERSCRCVSCDSPAELYCAGCKLTPYCGQRCQRRDWERRHRAVCHNLARTSAENAVKHAASDLANISVTFHPEPTAQSPPRKQPPLNDSGSERGGRKFIPPAEKHTAYQQVQRNSSRSVDIRNRNQTEEKNGNIASHNGIRGSSIDQKLPLRQPLQHIPDSKPVVEPKPPLTKGTDQYLPLRQPLQHKPDTKPAVEPTPPLAKGQKSASAARPGSLSDVTPRKPLVPTSMVLERLEVGAEFLAEAIAPAAACSSQQAGCVCLTLHADCSQLYDSLCDDFKAQCEKDAQEYTPAAGETFAYHCSGDGFWYRARCLGRARGALLDAGRVVSFTPRAARRLPPGYAAAPEFMAVLDSDELAIGENLSCKVVSVSNGIRVSVQQASGNTVEVDVARWLPVVEYPEPQRGRQPQLDQSPEQQTVKPAQAEPSPAANAAEVPEPQAMKPKLREKRATQTEVVRPLVPTSMVLERLEVGAEFLAEAIAPAAACSSQQAGCVCLTLHADCSQLYDSLCEDFKAQCEKDSQEYTPAAGETFAYHCSGDGFWYRARCLGRARGALLDAGRVVSFTPRAARRLPPGYAAAPEFMAVLDSDELAIGENLSCKVVSVSNGIRVSVQQASGNTVEVAAERWLPLVEYPELAPTPRSVPKPVTVPTAIVEVPRPAINHNTVYVLLDVTSLKRACVRPCDPRLVAMFDGVLRDTLIYAMNASPIKEPPQKGQTVVAKYIEDEMHYRALVKRVNVSKNKYLIEYIEYGNEEIVPMERLYPCPEELSLSAQPAQASFVKLSDREPPTLTQAAVQYIDNLKDNAIQLILTIPGGAKSAPSGSLASLLIAKNCEPATKRIEELCTPEWRKLLERGGDVLEAETRFYHELMYCEVPQSRPFVLRMPHGAADALARGSVCGHEKGDKAADIVYNELAKQIEEYCESPLCRESYMPRLEELCITKHKRLNKWVRSVLVELPHGAGSKAASVLHVDYGDLELVAVADIRKMLPEFVDHYPAMAQHFEIKDFPTRLSDAQLQRALSLMRVTPLGEGELRVAAAREMDERIYQLEAPELLAALAQ